ncbi:MAG: ParB/RepB/Spo0J family partition protein [Candidatus Latescibacterota bacterium]
MSTHGSAASEETIQLAIDRIGERFAPLRIVDPQAERTMLHSIQKYGQLTPVVVCRIEPGSHELLDGFKRLRAGRRLGLTRLVARCLVLNVRACKAAMLQLNRVGKAISGMEEALVVHSLCHEDGLSQVEVAVLVGRHKSWVCRRVAMIARLSDEVQESIRLGLLPASLGAELAQLQRCNQEKVLGTINKHHLTWRETRRLVTKLMQQPAWAHEVILRDPRGDLAAAQDQGIDPAASRLGPQARGLHHQLLALERQCAKTAFALETTILGQFEVDEETFLRTSCGQALNSLGQARQALVDAMNSSREEQPDGRLHPQP